MNSFIINKTEIVFDAKITIKFKSDKNLYKIDFKVNVEEMLPLKCILNDNLLEKNNFEEISVFIYENFSSSLIFSKANSKSNIIICILKSQIYLVNSISSLSIFNSKFEKSSLQNYKDLHFLTYDCEIFNENSNFNLNNINSKILRDSYSYYNIKENEKDLFGDNLISTVQILPIFSEYNDSNYIKNNENMINSFKEIINELNPFRYEVSNFDQNNYIDTLKNFFNKNFENFLIIIGGKSKIINEKNEYLINENVTLSYELIRDIWIQTKGNGKKNLLIIYESTDASLWLNMNKFYSDDRIGIYIQISELKCDIKSEKSDFLYNLITINTNLNNEMINFNSINDYLANEEFISRKFNLYILFKNNRCMNFDHNIRKNYSKVHMGIYLSYYCGQFKYLNTYPFFHKEGLGIELTSNGDFYSGFWRENFYNFYGEYIWSSGNRYVGDLENGKIHGFGIYEWKNSDYFIGNFNSGFIDGYGIMKWNNNDIYEGNWHNDIKKGNGKYTWKNGKIKQGIWNDKKCKRIKENRESISETNSKIQKCNIVSRTNEVDLSLDLNCSLKDRLLDN